MNTLDWIGKWAAYTPDKVAVTCYSNNEKYTYEQLHLYANRLALQLQKLGFYEGDRVAVLAEHGPEYIVLFSACQRLGLILVALNYRMSSNDLKKLWGDCSPKILFYSLAQKTKLEELGDNVKYKATIESLKSLYLSGDFSGFPEYNINENNPLFIFYTSGTTGTPKGVVYTNKMLFWNSLNTSMQLGITFRDSTLNVLPPYHTSGWNIFITPLLHKGGHVGMLSKFDPDVTLRLMEQEKVTLFMGLPTMLQMMQKSVVYKEVSLGRLRYIISGGEKVNELLVSDWNREKGIFIRPGYGLTEAGPSITSLHHKMSLIKPNSIGKPNFYLEVKIVNDKNELVKYNEIGELCVKGDIVTPGYWNNSNATKDKIRGGWLHTGDLAYEDKDGFLYLKGRKDDMYISGGENIYPQEVEDVLERIDGVARASVFGVEDEQWGYCGIAFIEIKNNGVTVERVREYLRKNMTRYKHPKHIFVMEDIPLTSLSKVSRKKLRQYYSSLKIEV